MGCFDLHGRDIWVIGGAGYLGAALVALLRELQAQVLCADLGDRAQNLVSSSGWDDHVTGASLDASDISTAERFMEETYSRRGTPQGAVVMTYASTAKRLEDLTAEEFDRANHGNLTATFILARSLCSRMAKSGGGSLVLFSSMYGSVSPEPEVYETPLVPNPVEYGTGKAGIQQLARYLGVHYGGGKVRCNSISPGPFPSPLVQKEHPEFVARLAKKTPLGRVGRAEEIAGATAFLLSDAASYITGHNLAVDGGWTAW